MVCFTCDICGATLKKNQVEKHYKTVCRDAWYFTCIDCNKVFEGVEYEKHTSCITETEKYAGKFLAEQAKKKEIAKSNIDDVVKKDKANEELKYLLPKKEWMGWKRTIRHILQDQKEKKIELDSLWKVVKETYMKSTAYKGQDKQILQLKFKDKIDRPRFELVEDGKFLKLKARK